VQTTGYLETLERATPRLQALTFGYSEVETARIAPLVGAGIRGPLPSAETLNHKLEHPAALCNIAHSSKQLEIDGRRKKGVARANVESFKSDPVSLFWSFPNPPEPR